jgi:putative addiction module component (TIGR02574 family)
MTRNARQVLDAALALSQKERADVAYQLIRSLDGPEPTAEEQAEIAAAWAVEIERRVKEIDDGRAELIPAGEVFTEIEQRLRRSDEPQVSRGGGVVRGTRRRPRN